MTDFIQKLKRKKELMLEVMKLTDAQTQLIENEDTDALLTNIAERQKLIDLLDSIQADLPDKDSLKRNNECLQLITEVNGILEKIQAQDERNESAALERMSALRNQLKKVNEGRKTFSGYETGGAQEIGGIYINKDK